MAIVDVIGTQEQIEDYNIIIRPLYWIAFKAKYSKAKTRVQEGYIDRITGEVITCTWWLSINGKDHSDRLNDYIKHPDYPDTDKCLVSYETTREADPLDIACYYNLTARTANGSHASLTNNTRAEAKAQGFFPE